ncbi:MAG: YihA family ribosome biogenesis GTP-binding protein, partial [Clostridia bacterium]|nr:YihA family ribosome biogenesis GTP-binding protein [Clostridia bacterium]
MQFEGSVGLVRQLKHSDLPEIVFSGKSNVGKSSLINKLLNRKSIAKVSSTPGKTQTINFFRLKKARLVDLPGYGYSKVSDAKKELWGELMETYFSSGRDIRLVVQLLDMRHPPTKDDIGMLKYLDDSRYDFIVVLTKSDKLNKTQTEKRLNQIEHEL